MKVVPFRAEHLGGIEGAEQLLGAEQARALERCSSWTALAGEEVLGCAGVVKIWSGRYVAWSYLSPQRSGRYMRQITRAVRAFIEELDARRIELSVVADFEAGHRWAKMLGFTLETPAMPGFGPNGETHAMYVKVKED